jgi:hypothetical protein
MDDDGLDELERQLDATFASARPRPEFRAELGERLRRRLPPGGAFNWAGLVAALAAVFVIGVTGVAVASLASHGHNGGASMSSAMPARAPAQGHGELPRPAAGGRTDSGVQAGSSPSAEALGRVAVAATPPPAGGQLPVYRYVEASGIAAGTVYEPGAVPPGLAAASYPARPADQAMADARVAAAGLRADRVTLTGWRLVYVAVPDGTGGGYLEPVFQVTGTAETGGAGSPVSLQVPAVADPALR